MFDFYYENEPEYYDDDYEGAGGGEEEQRQQVHWECTMSQNKYPQTEARSSYHLYVYPEERDEKWEQISQLTREDSLGYMSSISPDTMRWGAHEGAYTISVHKDNDETEAVQDAIESAGLGDRIFQHTPIIPRERDDANYDNMPY